MQDFNQVRANFYNKDHVHLLITFPVFFEIQVLFCHAVLIHNFTSYTHILFN